MSSVHQVEMECPELKQLSGFSTHVQAQGSYLICCAVVDRENGIGAYLVRPVAAFASAPYFYGLYYRCAKPGGLTLCPWHVNDEITEPLQHHKLTIAIKEIRDEKVSDQDKKDGKRPHKEVIVRLTCDDVVAEKIVMGPPLPELTPVSC